MLALAAFVAELPAAVSTLAAIASTAPAAIAADEAIRAAVRDLLRHGGYKPSGRNKPASEYLARAAAEGAFPAINAAVDVGNAISLASGLPVSVVDADRVTPPLVARVAPPGTTYPFNPSGQVFDAAGLICLFDADGVCATPVKDAQRTKTTPATTRVLCVVWGVHAAADHTARTVADYQARMRALGARVTVVHARADR